MLHIRYFIAIVFLLSTSLISFSANDNIPQSIAETKQGKLRGTVENGISVWKGVRYAKAPVGDLRFRAPQQLEKWEGVKDAVEFGTIEVQPQSKFNAGGEQSEDCLFLNIWSPAADGKKRPVMFWIHGGGFIVGAGSSPLYNGNNLAKNGDVVVVTINYRLGPLGFLYFKNENGFDNNLGIRDQIAALKWVNENIAAFGGDPNTITIFGESAGGTSVETLLAAKSAKGLFQRAIAESGPPAILWDKDAGELITAKYLEILGVEKNNFAKLKAIPADTLKVAEDKLLNWMIAETNHKVFSPTIDGEILTGDIFKCLKPDPDNIVSLMIGTNKNEATMFASKKLKMVPDDSEGLEKYMDGATTQESKKKVISAYTNYPRKSGVLDILTDAVFRIPAIRIAECQSQFAPVYMYRFDYTSFLLNASGMKSFHGLEIPFVFGNTGMKLMKFIASKKRVKQLTVEMQGAWLNFAKFGNPNGNSEDVWKKYDTEKRATMIFKKKTELVYDPDGEVRKAWDGVTYY